MTTTDLFSGTNQSDGEGITFGDMNDAPRFGMARLFDQILENLIGDVSLSQADPEFSGLRGANAPNHLAYALHGGSAFLRQGSANNKLQIAPGVLFQKIANQSGAEPTLAPYSFVGSEEVAITAGDATNPRVDLVQMKLEWVAADSQSRDFQDAVTGANSTTTFSKKRRVQCTLSVKVGTPAATPTYPDPDAGFVALAGVFVGTSYATGTALTFGLDQAGATAVVHDQRMPLRVRGDEVWPRAMNILTNWTVSNSGIISANVTNSLSIPVPCSAAQRLVGVRIEKDAAAAFTTSRLFTGGTASGGDMNNVAVTSAANNFIPYYTIEAGHAPALGVKCLPSAVNKICAPVWGAGRCAIPQGTADARWLIWSIASGSASSSITRVRFYVAGG